MDCYDAMQHRHRLFQQGKISPSEFRQLDDEKLVAGEELNDDAVQAAARADHRTSTWKQYATIKGGQNRRGRK